MYSMPEVKIVADMKDGKKIEEIAINTAYIAYRQVKYLNEYKKAKNLQEKVESL